VSRWFFLVESGALAADTGSFAVGALGHATAGAVTSGQARRAEVFRL